MRKGKLKMKHKILNFFKVTVLAFIIFLSSITLTSCKLENLFVFGGQTDSGDANPDIETFEGTKNALFFALYNYYGYEGQHFTNKWLGMRDALLDHGITVTGYEGEKDARKFKITREADCDLPEDTVIYMVNNQNWDAGIQFTKPFARYHPMVVISTCNGVEFASSPILSSGDKISNATMGGFSPTYREAFVNGSLHYVVAKYSAHVAPIFAAAVDAVLTGQPMRNADGSALHLSISTWAIQTLSEFDEMSAVDSIDSTHPTVRKINIDKFFDKTSPDYGPEKLAEYEVDGMMGDGIGDVLVFPKSFTSPFHESDATDAVDNRHIVSMTGLLVVEKFGIFTSGRFSFEVAGVAHFDRGRRIIICHLSVFDEDARHTVTRSGHNIMIVKP